MSTSFVSVYLVPVIARSSHGRAIHQQRWSVPPVAELRPRYVTTPFGITRVRMGGHGDPPAVFISGAGDGLQVWRDVLPAAAHETQVIAYDRLGLGHSAPAPVRRDARQICQELDTLLTSLKAGSQFVLVSHSAGAFHVRMFAHLYPAKVSGMLFVEPSHEDWLDELKRMDAKAWATHLQWRQKRSHTAGRRRELAAWETLVAEMRSIGPTLPAVPITVISATAGHSSATQVLFQLHQRWIEHLPGARHIITAAAGHYVQHDAPALVADALTDLLEKVRACAHAPTPVA